MVSRKRSLRLNAGETESRKKICALDSSPTITAEEDSKSNSNSDSDIANQTDFALRLAGHVASTVAAGSNLAMSPISIGAMLSLISAGSSGPTLDQFLSVLGSKDAGELRSLASHVASDVLVDQSGSGGPSVAFANGGWIDQSCPLKASFKETLASVYKADVIKSVDFINKAEEVRGEVNSWIEKSTKGHIKELLPSGSLSPSTRLLFANALYFKGAWNQKFDASRTKKSKFHQLDGSSVLVPFMTSTKNQLLEAFDGFKVLQLPYSKGKDTTQQFSMYIFLPDARDGLWDLSRRLSSESGFLDRHCPWTKATGKFKLPKFKISFQFEAANVLKDLGLELPFTCDADLTEMADSSHLHVSSVFHESIVEVNEEGTKAVATTIGRLQMCCLAPRIPTWIDFEADHPFVFLIREDITGAVLFVGHVLNPLST